MVTVDDVFCRFLKPRIGFERINALTFPKRVFITLRIEFNRLTFDSDVVSECPKFFLALEILVHKSITRDTVFVNHKMKVNVR